MKFIPKIILIPTALFYSVGTFAAEMDAEQLMQAAQSGNMQAQAQLGEAYLTGHDDIGINYDSAFRWSNEAAAKGDKRAVRNLGILYLNGWGTPKDYIKALELLEQATEEGDMKAPRYAGLIYQQGLGVPQDYAKAAEFFQIGDSRNDINSQYYLGKLYEQGLGVSQNYTKALELYTRNPSRIDQVTAPGFVAAGDLYANGLGVLLSKQKAKEWYEKALKAGNKDAEARLRGL